MITAAELLAKAGSEPFRSAPEPVRRRVVFLVADVLAAAVSAFNRPEVRAAATALLAGGSGPASVIGRVEGQSAPLAALINAMPVAAEQLQDGHRGAKGHPAAHVVPAVLAATEACGSSGAETLAAILSGYEIGVRVGEAMGGTPGGVHDIGTWGPIGAAAGVAHVCSAGDVEVVAAAIDLAAAVPFRPDAETVFGGATGQHLLLGMAVQSAVVTGTSAVAGLRAPVGTLERYYLPALGAKADQSRLVDGLFGSTWGNYKVLDGYIKRHPTCAHLHGINDAVEDLLRDETFEPGSVERVVVRTYTAASAFDHATPEGDLAARFSIPFTVAVALVSGSLTVGSFSERWTTDRTVRDLAGRVEVRSDPALDGGYPAGRPAVVTVFKADGSVVEAAASRPRGDGPDALDDARVSSKPFDLLSRSVGSDQATLVMDAVARLETEGPAAVGSVLRGLRADPSPF